MKNGVFFVVTPCGSCKNRRFGGTWRLLHPTDILISQAFEIFWIFNGFEVFQYKAKRFANMVDILFEILLLSVVANICEYKTHVAGAGVAVMCSEVHSVHGQGWGSLFRDGEYHTPQTLVGIKSVI
jgi:hypothetical protein